MARPKKDGKRATGIQGKRGYLYIITYNFIKDGVKIREKQWISTGLTDTAENIKKASEMRLRYLNKKEVATSDRNVTIIEYADAFLNKKSREVSGTTYSSYFYRVKRIKDYFGDTRVRDLTESMVEGFLDNMFEEDHVQHRTVKDVKVVFGGIMEQAVKEGLIPYNPVKEVVINKNLVVKYAKEKNTDEAFFSYEEAQIFLSNIKDHDGKVYYPDYPTKTFTKLIRKMPELPQDITFHGLRSSCVSILVHQGMDVKSIQKWVGHADIDTTLRIYAKVKDKESKREISDAMTDIIPLKNYEEDTQ